MVDKDVTISQLVLRTDLLRSQVFALEQAKAQLQREIGQLRTDNQHLKDQVARLKRDSSNSSKPPSSDIVKPKKNGTSRGRRQRKIGGQKGHPRHERIPFAPDDIGPILPYELSPKQAQGPIPLEEWFVLQQVDLAQKLYLVTEHRARKYLDPRTGRIVIAPLPVAVQAAGPGGRETLGLGRHAKRMPADSMIAEPPAYPCRSSTASRGFSCNTGRSGVVSEGTCVSVLLCRRWVQAGS